MDPLVVKGTGTAFPNEPIWQVNEQITIRLVVIGRTPFGGWRRFAGRFCYSRILYTQACEKIGEAVKLDGESTCASVYKSRGIEADTMVVRDDGRFTGALAGRAGS